MSRRTVVWISIAAVLVGVLVAGALYERAHSTPQPGAGSPAANSPGGNSATRPAPSNSGAVPSSKAGGMTQPQGGAAAARTGAGANSNSTQDGPATLVTDPRSKLAPVTTPPSKTLAMMSHSTAATGSEFDVVFVPYGLGPSSPRPTIVAQLNTVKVTKGTLPKISLQGRNVLLHVAPGTNTAVANGGTYSGKVVVVPDGTAVVLQLNSAVPVKK